MKHSYHPISLNCNYLLFDIAMLQLDQHQHPKAANELNMIYSLPHSLQMEAPKFVSKYNSPSPLFDLLDLFSRRQNSLFGCERGVCCYSF
jgi:hypothetical protein